MTLKELWEEKGLSPTQLAAQAGITVSTLYTMNRKDPKKPVARKTIIAVCNALGITREQYENLDKAKREE